MGETSEGAGVLPPLCLQHRYQLERLLPKQRTKRTARVRETADRLRRPWKELGRDDAPRDDGTTNAVKLPQLQKRFSIRSGGIILAMASKRADASLTLRGPARETAPALRWSNAPGQPLARDAATILDRELAAVSPSNVRRERA